MGNVFEMEVYYLGSFERGGRGQQHKSLRVIYSGDTTNLRAEGMFVVDGQNSYDLLKQIAPLNMGDRTDWKHIQKLAQQKVANALCDELETDFSGRTGELHSSSLEEMYNFLTDAAAFAAYHNYPGMSRRFTANAYSLLMEEQRRQAIKADDHDA